MIKNQLIISIFSIIPKKCPKNPKSPKGLHSVFCQKQIFFSLLRVSEHRFWKLLKNCIECISQNLDRTIPKVFMDILRFISKFTKFYGHYSPFLMKLPKKIILTWFFLFLDFFRCDYLGIYTSKYFLDHFFEIRIKK